MEDLRQQWLLDMVSHATLNQYTTNETTRRFWSSHFIFTEDLSLYDKMLLCSHTILYSLKSIAFLKIFNI